ncbi:NAD(P)/FAD-dependent oxidoreductase [Thermoactinospora rubra]|uniref:NAD(P)/FAD-dependent oxidoreductase n=1 Tax=Thermoactinospora rubra TaxID=1088767 RepID=UPI000A1064A1|nr:FAD-dependent monooxygenase [Thermoactinospora rubra]
MTPYDAIVVGARCPGAPTAMLPARRGYRVLLADRASFPNDTLPTHVIHPPGVAAPARWGLLDRVTATGCPPLRRYSFDFGPFTIAGTPHAHDGVSTAYAPRRTLLDKILVDGAAASGAEVRERFTVEDVLAEDGAVTGVRGHGAGGASVTERAMPVYEFTAQLATPAPPPAEVQRLLAAVSGDPEAMDAFAGVIAETLSPAEFFDPANIARILGLSMEGADT